MEKTTRFNYTYLVLALLGVVVIQALWGEARSTAVIPYSQFQELLKAGQIEEVAVSQSQLQGTLEEPIDGRTRFVTTRVPLDLARQLEEAGTKFKGEIESQLLPTLMSWLIPIALFFGIWLLFMRSMAKRGPGGGLLQIGKSGAKVYVETETRVSFSDVAGVDEAKAELEEVVAFLKNPDDYGRLGARMPKGILLVGPPGTGKTLLARAVAGEAAVPFFSISGSEFVEMFVGVGAARVRDLFEQARQRAPCIIFIDELDALARARSAQPGMGSHDEKEQTLNQLLVELDGFDASTGIVLLGATNRPEILDPALLRAGRFDRQVLVDRPDRQGRGQILRVHLRSIAVSPDLDPDEVAALTPGFTGADLANLVNEAALAATRRDAAVVEMIDFNVAVERIVAGLEKRNRLINEKERRVVAHHEMGHALVAAALPGTDPVHKISIIPRGIGALGYTMQRPLEDRYLMTRAELSIKMAVLLGGRAAEKIVFDHLSTGAADDLAKTADIATNMVMRYAMSEQLGHVAYDTEPSGFLGAGMPALRSRNYSEDTAREIDCAVRDFVDEAFARAIRILTDNRDLLEAGAELLIERETLVEADLQELFRRIVRPAERSAPE